ncbi:hypothetical protein BDV30DRAFT_224559 [Aspergillus minisclerotigenes]|uniref:Uncharacterized protein n=1 Tax=Aspergillus minisclerotigenes TaxID=656917 RepID=A0A5N6JBI5_9EURO|nr:hypothetical protein BDV30DRAFT_224559 [Aspergillus minisclerotigenes]
MDPDPFGRLPLFVLQRILSNLPGLPALHSVYKASPKVAGFLHQNNDLFARIVDSIIDNPARERGLAPHVQDTIRLIILVWSQTQESETDILSILHYVRERPSDWPAMLKAISPLTRSAIICRLLRLMVRLRCLVHAYFHSTITKCLRLQVEHLPRKARYHSTRAVVDHSRRPQGIPYTPVDIGPPTWAEEQRLLSSFLCIVLFYELRKTHIECPLDFWGKVLWKRNNEGQEEQIATLLHWLDQQAGGRENVYPWLRSSNASEDYSSCCQCYTTVINAQMDGLEIMDNSLNTGRSSRGMLCVWLCKGHPISPLKGLDSSVFRPCGLVFWDGVRMDSLGFPEGRGAPHRMWFALSSIFTEKNWKELLRRQPTIAAAVQVQV